MMDFDILVQQSMPSSISTIKGMRLQWFHIQPLSAPDGTVLPKPQYERGKIRFDTELKSFFDATGPHDKAVAQCLSAEAARYLRDGRRFVVLWDEQSEKATPILSASLTWGGKLLGTHMMGKSSKRKSAIRDELMRWVHRDMPVIVIQNMISTMDMTPAGTVSSYSIDYNPRWTTRSYGGLSFTTLAELELRMCVLAEKHPDLLLLTCPTKN